LRTEKADVLGARKGANLLLRDGIRKNRWRSQTIFFSTKETRAASRLRHNLGNRMTATSNREAGAVSDAAVGTRTLRFEIYRYDPEKDAKPYMQKLEVRL